GHASFTPGQTSASPSRIQGGSRMRECRTSGSVRGVPSNGHPYRNPLGYYALVASVVYSASLTCAPQAVPWPCSPASDSARCANRRSGAAPCQWIVSGGILTVSPGFSTCGFSPSKQMRPTPDKQKSVCPTGWECHAVRAPGVNVTTEPPRRDGASAVITGSWNTTPVKVSAAPRLVFRAPARMTPALTGMTVLLQWRRPVDQRHQYVKGAPAELDRLAVGEKLAAMRQH